MANKSTKKSKKPLQTTLGRATSNTGEKIDLSNVRKPIHTSIHGLSELLSLRETSTPEVRCNIIIFSRIFHKRNFRLSIILRMNVILFMNVGFAVPYLEVWPILFYIKESTVVNNSMLYSNILGVSSK